MTTMRYETIQMNCGPVAVPVPNALVEGVGFYISYNDHDTGIYGSDTTALVVGQMEKFYILAGDHRVQYQSLLAGGFDACLAYYKANAKVWHRYSDKLAA